MRVIKKNTHTGAPTFLPAATHLGIGVTHKETLAFANFWGHSTPEFQ